MVNSFFAAVFAGMVGVTLFVSCFLLGFSFDTIDPNRERACWHWEIRSSNSGVAAGPNPRGGRRSGSLEAT